MPISIEIYPSWKKYTLLLFHNTLLMEVQESSPCIIGTVPCFIGSPGEFPLYYWKSRRVPPVLLEVQESSPCIPVGEFPPVLLEVQESFPLYYWKSRRVSPVLLEVQESSPCIIGSPGEFPRYPCRRVSPCIIGSPGEFPLVLLEVQESFPCIIGSPGEFPLYYWKSRRVPPVSL